MKHPVYKRIIAGAAALCMAVTLLSAGALAASPSLNAAADRSNLLAQGAGCAVTAASAGDAVTAVLSLPKEANPAKTVTVLVSGGSSVRYILGRVSGGSVIATYQEPGVSDFTMMAAQGSIDPGSLTISGSALQFRDGYQIRYQADITISDDLAMLAAVNKSDTDKLKALRFTCVLEDALLAQMGGIDGTGVDIPVSSVFECVSVKGTSAGLSVVYKLSNAVLEEWSADTVTPVDIVNQLQTPMSVTCTGTVTAGQLAQAQNGAGDVYTYGVLKITNEDGSAIPGLGGATQIVVPAGLSRMAVTAGDSSIFTDVPAGEYYAPAVDWAVANKITVGTTATTFSPDEVCTRAQIVTFLYRAAGEPDVNVSRAAKFTDVKLDPADPDGWYAKAVAWAVDKGITVGTTATTFSPEEDCTRAQIVTFLWRYAGKPAVSAASPFTDVAAGEYYAPAVSWAVANRVTVGTTATTFSPDEGCTRAQIVTFLYRHLA